MFNKLVLAIFISLGCLLCVSINCEAQQSSKETKLELVGNYVEAITLQQRKLRVLSKDSLKAVDKLPQICNRVGFLEIVEDMHEVDSALEGLILAMCFYGAILDSKSEPTNIEVALVNSRFVGSQNSIEIVLLKLNSFSCKNSFFEPQQDKFKIELQRTTDLLKQAERVLKE